MDHKSVVGCAMFAKRADSNYAYISKSSRAKGWPLIVIEKAGPPTIASFEWTFEHAELEEKHVPDDWITAW
jgi:hypothetical protein